MTTHLRTTFLGALLVLWAGAGFAVTVLAPGSVAENVDTLADPTDLWVRPAELPRINGFELKPEGACKGELCIPVTGDEDPIVTQVEGVRWFSLTAFARRVGQAYAVDRERHVWSFGDVPAARSSGLLRAQAPEFTLPNRAGESVTLSQFRGRKVLLLSWASW